MGPRALLSLGLGALAAVLLAACGGGDDGDEERAQNYALQVERISDDAYEAAQDGLVTLNKLSDGSIEAKPAIAALDRSSKQVSTDSDRLSDLTPPESGKATADDLAFQLDSLARSLDEAAATTSAVSRGNGSVPGHRPHLRPGRARVPVRIRGSLEGPANDRDRRRRELAGEWAP